MRAYIFLALSVFVPAACSSNTVVSAHGDLDGTSDAGLPQCSWPASLDLPPVDAGSPAWTVGRTYLRCKDGNATELCVSDNLTTCPGPNAVPGGVISDCVNQCRPDEYVVVSGGPPILSPDGGVTSRPMPDLPASCRGLAPNPSGWVTQCCPCE